MRSPSFALISVFAALLAPCGVWGADSTASDRIAVSASGSTLTGTNGGAGESLGWLLPISRRAGISRMLINGSFVTSSSTRFSSAIALEFPKA